MQEEDGADPADQIGQLWGLGKEVSFRLHHVNTPPDFYVCSLLSNI
jgi:hypothetical protein